MAWRRVEFRDLGRNPWWFACTRASISGRALDRIREVVGQSAGHRHNISTGLPHLDFLSGGRSPPRAELYWRLQPRICSVDAGDTFYSDPDLGIAGRSVSAY